MQRTGVDMGSIASCVLRFGRILSGGAWLSLLFLAVACEPEPSKTSTGEGTKPAASSEKSAPAPATGAPASAKDPATGGAKTAKGKIEGRSGSKLTGEVTLTEADGAVK